MELSKALRYGAIGVGVLVVVGVVFWLVQAIVGFVVNLLTTALTVLALLVVLYLAIRAVLWLRGGDEKSAGRSDLDGDSLADLETESEDPELDSLLDDDRDSEPERSR